MAENDPVPVRSAMVIVAHPDDAEFGCSASVAKWVSQGITVTYVICTDGGAGSADPALTAADLPRLRAEEQERAAAVLGVAAVEFLGRRDGELVADLTLRRDLTRMIRRHRPDRVVCQNAVRTYSNVYGNHPDHLAAGQAAMEAVYPTARNPLAFPDLLAEGLGPHVVREVWVTGTDQPNHAEDVSGFVDRKIEALMQHRSQMGAEPDRVAERVRQRMQDAGRPSGVAFAEAFRRLSAE
ncbi:MAG TPA: PIG-L deacetylase family protein [Verrucomicrobiae bacterium]|nr:PIG-L deacetylase family protein [Verrucomicrobiae bacterium]